MVHSHVSNQGRLILFVGFIVSNRFFVSYKLMLCLLLSIMLFVVTKVGSSLHFSAFDGIIKEKNLGEV